MSNVMHKTYFSGVDVLFWTLALGGTFPVYHSSILAGIVPTIVLYLVVDGIDRFFAYSLSEPTKDGGREISRSVLGLALLTEHFAQTTVVSLVLIVSAKLVGWPN